MTEQELEMKEQRVAFWERFHTVPDLNELQRFAEV
jgi:hypothetical protein